MYVACWCVPSDADPNHEWQAARWGAQLQDQKQAILGHTAAMDRVTDFSGATGPTVSWDHDTISMCCITCRVKMAQPYLGLSIGSPWLSLGEPFLSSFAQMGLESSVYWHVLFVVFQISLPVWLYFSRHSHLQHLFVWYANTEGEGLGDVVTCSYIR